MRLPAETVPAVPGADQGESRTLHPLPAGSFWVPLASRMAAEGVVVDAAAANLAAGRWLREVANARQHATTGAVPAERLAEERPALRGIPAPYGGIVPATLRPPRPVRPILGTQHPLAVYDALLALPEGVA